MARIALPDSIQVKLDDLAGRLRRLRLIRGASAVVLTFVGVAASALIADAWLELPTAARFILLALWVAATGFAIWLGFIRPRRVSAGKTNRPSTRALRSRFLADKRKARTRFPHPKGKPARC